MSGFSKVIQKPVYSTYEKQLEKEVLENEVPKHVAIIMDGNRRYAQEVLGQEINEGHKLGEEKIEEMLEWCLDLNIKYITVFAFSTENFNREDEEVDFLMDLAEAALYRMADNARVQENHVRIRILGDHKTLPERVIKAMEYADEKTGAFDDFHFNVALAYGSRQEITEAVREIAVMVKNGEINPEDVTEKMLSEHLYTSEIPDPDLLLRTSGEVRLSNFLLWQMAYSELYFTDIYWPGFRYIDLLRAIRAYQQRIRRYGK